jgi:beta-glucanase (GH16 family)
VPYAGRVSRCALENLLVCLVLAGCTNELRFDAPATGAGAGGGAASLPEGPAGPWVSSFAEECDALDPTHINAFLPDGSGEALHTWSLRAEYMDESNVSVQDGHCVISVRREQVEDRLYTSGALSTGGLFTQRGGYFEARLWPPTGRGFWTFFWLRHHDHRWPPAIEPFNFSNDAPNYTAQFYDPDANQHSARIETDVLTDGFHSVGVEWSDSELVFYLDGAEQYRVATDVAKLTTPMYPALNLSINTEDFGAPLPDATTPAEAELRLDWLRVWRRP